MDPTSTTQATDTRATRIENIQRMNKARRRLTTTLGQVFTREELGQLFDALPADLTQPMVTLAEAVGQAWADAAEPGKQDPA